MTTTIEKQETRGNELVKLERVAEPGKRVHWMLVRKLDGTVTEEQYVTKGLAIAAFLDGAP